MAYLVGLAAAFWVGAYASWSRWDWAVHDRIKTITHAIPQLPTVAQAIDRYPFLAGPDANGALITKPGVWDVPGDLLVPRRVTLVVSAGTTLRFGTDAILYATAPVHLDGRPGKPIVFEPQGDRWAGVIIYSKSESPSVWRDAVIHRTGHVTRAGRTLKGAVTFYRNSVHLIRCRFTGNAAEDAIRVIHGNVVFEDCAFIGCVSDAFDGDFVTGRIENCRFENIGNDAVDAGGSILTVKNITVRGVGDKAVSVGEQSRVTIIGLDVDGVDIAVASMDMSVARIQGAVIRRARIGLAVAVTVPQYGPARIVAENIEFSDTTHEVLVQPESSISIDGREQLAVPFDVQMLFAQGPIGI